MHLLGHRSFRTNSQVSCRAPNKIFEEPAEYEEKSVSES